MDRLRRGDIIVELSYSTVAPKARRVAPGRGRSGKEGHAGQETRPERKGASNEGRWTVAFAHLDRSDHKFPITSR